MGGKLCALSLDEKGDPPFFLSFPFSNLGTVEVRLQVGADKKVFFFFFFFLTAALGIEPRTSHTLGVLSVTGLFAPPPPPPSSVSGLSCCGLQAH